MRTAPASSSTLEAYLARLQSELAALPVNELDDIILETRSHVFEQTSRDQARNVESVLMELGAPEVYANRFLSQRGHADEDESALSGLARLSGSGLAGFVLLIPILIGYAIALLAVVIAIWKVVAPSQIGLWVRYVNGVRLIAAGVMDVTPGGVEILGYWLAIGALMAAAAIHLGLSAVLRRVGRKT